MMDERFKRRGVKAFISSALTGIGFRAFGQYMQDGKEVSRPGVWVQFDMGREQFAVTYLFGLAETDEEQRRVMLGNIADALNGAGFEAVVNEQAKVVYIVGGMDVKEGIQAGQQHS